MTEQPLTDQRRKLTTVDYQKIRFYASQNFTIRDLAGEFGISTKYVNKVLDATVTFDQAGDVHFVMGPDASTVPTMPVIGSTNVCLTASGGCGRWFSSAADLSGHWSFWTSSGTQTLNCVSVMAGIASH